jgi:hypothetical protein
MAKKKKEKVKGTPGWYQLNQKVQKFEDRRTRRNRTRSENRRRAIADACIA